MSRRLLEEAAAATNVFLFSHGWMGDVPAAVKQYDRWIHAFAASDLGRRRAAEAFPGFQPLFIGLHWPSLPWGDEELSDNSFAVENGSSSKPLLESYVERLGDTPPVRAALETIFEEARRDALPEQLSQRARDAILNLNDALGLKSDGGINGPPDADREPFDPDAALEAGAEAAFGGNCDVFAGLLGLVRLCSYWTMKKRARLVGEGGMNTFVRALQQCSGAKIHLMGHSFGCVVVSSILGGPNASGTFSRPIDSVVLAQGALSLWSYAGDIPFTPGVPGYFHGVIADGKVRGPLVTTQSRFDTAVGVQYPRASTLASQIAFEAGEYPKYGAVGTFGLQGLSPELKTDRPMLACGGDYGFARGRVYNLEASQFISHGSGSSGAHNDIAGPEVADAIWQAALSSA